MRGRGHQPARRRISVAAWELAVGWLFLRSHPQNHMTGSKAFVFMGLRPGILSKANPLCRLALQPGRQFVVPLQGRGVCCACPWVWLAARRITGLVGGPDQGASAVREKRPLLSSFAQGASPPAENRGCTSRGRVRSVLL